MKGPQVSANMELDFTTAKSISAAKATSSFNIYTHDMTNTWVNGTLMMKSNWRPKQVCEARASGTTRLK